MENEVIETSFDIRWHEPVWVKVGYGIADPVRGPRQALTYLDAREAARSAFIRAAREARMLAS